MDMRSAQSQSFDVFRQYAAGLSAAPGCFVDQSAPASPSAARAFLQDYQQKGFAVHPQAGFGWTDLHAIGRGLLIGRMHCQFAQATNDRYAQFPDNVRLGIILAGHERLDCHGLRQAISAPGQIIVRNGDAGPLHTFTPKDMMHSGISIDVPRQMLDTLAEQGVDLAALGARNSCRILQTSEQMGQMLAHMGQRMLSLNTSNHLPAQLELESLALDMLVKILQLGAGSTASAQRLQSQGRWQIAVDDALGIIEAKWNQPLTIAQLARQCGINESYLKTLFKARTGTTIADYVRSTRLRHARHMLESGHHSLQQITHLCGYSRTDKFTQAFERHYGHKPSALNTRQV